MQFEQRYGPAIADGSLTLTFRRWMRSQVVAGPALPHGGGDRSRWRPSTWSRPTPSPTPTPRRPGTRRRRRWWPTCAGRPTRPLYRVRVPRRGRARSTRRAGRRRRAERRPTWPTSTGGSSGSTGPAPDGPWTMAVLRGHRRAAGGAGAGSGGVVRAGDAAVQARRAQAEGARAHPQPADRVPALAPRRGLPPPHRADPRSNPSRAEHARWGTIAFRLRTEWWELGLSVGGVRIDVFTIFPDLVDRFCTESLLGRARAAGLPRPALPRPARPHHRRPPHRRRRPLRRRRRHGAAARAGLRRRRGRRPAPAPVPPRPGRPPLRPAAGPRAGRRRRLQPAVRPLRGRRRPGRHATSSTASCRSATTCSAAARWPPAW